MKLLLVIPCAKKSTEWCLSFLNVLDSFKISGENDLSTPFESFYNSV